MIGSAVYVFVARNPQFKLDFAVTIDGQSYGEFGIPQQVGGSDEVDYNVPLYSTTLAHGEHTMVLRSGDLDSFSPSHDPSLFILDYIVYTYVRCSWAYGARHADCSRFTDVTPTPTPCRRV